MGRGGRARRIPWGSRQGGGELRRGYLLSRPSPFFLLIVSYPRSYALTPTVHLRYRLYHHPRIVPSISSLVIVVVHTRVAPLPPSPHVPPSLYSPAFLLFFLDLKYLASACEESPGISKDTRPWFLVFERRIYISSTENKQETRSWPRHGDRTSEGSSHGLKSLRLLIVLGSSPASSTRLPEKSTPYPSVREGDRRGRTESP